MKANLVRMFGFAHGGYLMAKTTPSPDVEDGDDERPLLMLRTVMTSATPVADFQPPKARRRRMIPDKRMDESSQGI
jgi:hypothetical protein